MGRRFPAGRAYGLKSEHPHGRGEKRLTAKGASKLGGTSPRAWGEDCRSKGEPNTARNIPTGVGRSTAKTMSSWSSSEHPHGRGEKESRPRPSLRCSGTSPRAWGEAQGRSGRVGLPRNIPTGVGRRTSSSRSSRRRAEHPHGRGEKGSYRTEVRWRDGTSPRAWGEDDDHHPLQERQRNIPTGVGRSLPCAFICAYGSEHPHGRGEKGQLFGNAGTGDGTSPRAWGEAVERGEHGFVARNIPTGVGRRVRPRACHT